MPLDRFLWPPGDAPAEPLALAEEGLQSWTLLFSFHRPGISQRARCSRLRESADET